MVSVPAHFSTLVVGSLGVGTKEGILATREKYPFANCQLGLGAAGSDGSFTP